MSGRHAAGGEHPGAEVLQAWLAPRSAAMIGLPGEVLAITRAGASLSGCSARASPVSCSAKRHLCMLVGRRRHAGAKKCIWTRPTSCRLFGYLHLDCLDLVVAGTRTSTVHQQMHQNA